MNSNYFLILVALLFSLEGFGSVTRLCKVKYKTEEGWSKEKIYEVEFCTGTELNTRTHSLKYSQNQTYCLIWFAPDQVALLKTSGVGWIHSDKFSHQDFKNLFQFRREIDCTQETDDNGRDWVIIGKGVMEFIDPRGNEDE